MSALCQKRTLAPLQERPCGADDWNVKNFCALSSMTTRPERFRVKAIECSIAAQKNQDPKTRETYLELMRCWRDLADEIEHFEHSWLDSGGS
jgi:hypothetical protein